MEPVLSELSLIPCPSVSVGVRIQQLAETLRALDKLGTEKVLRSVSDAKDRNVGQHHGLRHWCFDSGTPRDAGLFVAGRLGRAPFLDGDDGLFAAAEGTTAVSAKVAGTESVSAGLVALSEGLLVLFYCPGQLATPVEVELHVIDANEEETTETREVVCVQSSEEVECLKEQIEGLVENSVRSGPDLHRRIGCLCPHLTLGAVAVAQLESLTGSEPFFRQVVRHLRCLNRTAEDWTTGPFRPSGITSSPESQATLKHKSYGPQRDFDTPAGFASDRWSLHTKITGVPGARLYYKVAEFRSESQGSVRIRVAVGYIGPHLDTVNHH